jgi:hypothetical protein
MNIEEQMEKLIKEGKCKKEKKNSYVEQPFGFDKAVGVILGDVRFVTEPSKYN